MDVLLEEEAKLLTLCNTWPDLLLTEAMSNIKELLLTLVITEKKELKLSLR